MHTLGQLCFEFQAKFLPHTGDCHLVTCARDGQVRLAQLSTTGTCKATKRLATHKQAAHKVQCWIFGDSTAGWCQFWLVLYSECRLPLFPEAWMSWGNFKFGQGERRSREKVVWFILSLNLVFSRQLLMWLFCFLYLSVENLSGKVGENLLAKSWN